jgi:plastocyanin
MRRTLLGLLAAAAIALAVGAVPAASQHGPEAEGAAGVPVSIGFAAVAPRRVDVVRGDTVTWTNNSVRAHTVTADDGSFDSGRLIPQGTFARTFDALGEAPYHCVLHPFIRGVVGVHTLLLAAPAEAAAPNRSFPLSGHAALPAGTAVAIEADRGTGFGPVATSTVAADGTFVARVIPSATATYRAVAGTDVSPPVGLLVLDRRVSFGTQRGRDRVLVRARVSPAAPGAHVVLQLFLHDHFGWWPVQRARLDHSSTARFSLRLGRRVAARVLLTLPDGATPLAISRTVRLGPTR